MATELRFDEILRTLARHAIDFVLVGGVAAILHGSPLTTEDLDVVYDASGDNLERLLKATKELDAHYLDLAGRHIEPDRAKLSTMKMHLLRTKFGRLDLLKTIAPEQTYADLVDRSQGVEVAGVTVRVLGLAAIIESKTHADRPKDRFQLPFLRQLEAEGTGGG